MISHTVNKAAVRLTRRWPARVEAELSRRYALSVEHDDRVLIAQELHTAMGQFQILCPTVTDRIEAPLFTAPDRQVRLIANYGAGTDHIDLEAARAAGIVVTNTPDVLTDATAELAVMLMMMASRRASEGERELREGRWSGWRPTHLLGQTLAGKTLGLVGFGRIGQATAQRAAAALGVKIAYHGRRRAAPAIEAQLGARFVPSLDALVSEVDILSLHCHGGAENRHLVNARLLARMKSTAIIINTARGSVVDERALAAALGAGRLWAAGLDVYEKEPQVNEALLAQPNAILLPHLGSALTDVREAMGMRALANIERFLAGEEVIDRVA